MNRMEELARVLNDQIKRQWDGHPIPGTEQWDPTSWTAEGGELDLTALARAVILQQIKDAEADYTQTDDQGVIDLDAIAAARYLRKRYLGEEK